MLAYEILNFFRKVHNKKIVYFGCGSVGKRLYALMPNKVEYCVDNNPNKHGYFLEDLLIKSPVTLLEENRRDITIIIASSFYQEIFQQLAQMGFEKAQIWDGQQLLAIFERYVAAGETNNNESLINLFSLHRQLQAKPFVMKEYLESVRQVYPQLTPQEQNRINALLSIKRMRYDKKHYAPQGLYEISLCNYYRFWEKMAQQGGLLAKVQKAGNIRRIAIWGTGPAAWCLFADAEQSGVQVAAFIDIPFEETETIMGIPVFSPEWLIDHGDAIDLIILAADTMTEAAEIKEKIIGAMGPRVPILFWRDIIADALDELNLTKTVFTDIYNLNGFNGTKSISGPGSDDKNTEKIRSELPLIINKLAIKSMLDLPCGDFYWMKNVDMRELDFYIGGDLVQELIKENQRRYGDAKKKFTVLDIVNNELPQVDLIFCRDCFIHLPNKYVIAAINNIKKSESKYLMTTTYTDRQENVDIMVGEARCINLERAPFSFPQPLLCVNEGYKRNNGQYADRSMALWRIADLPLLSLIKEDK